MVEAQVTYPADQSHSDADRGLEFGSIVKLLAAAVVLAALLIVPMVARPIAGHQETNDDIMQMSGP